VKPRITATIHYNTVVNGRMEQTGAFEFAEFTKLMKDFENSRKSPAVGSVPCYFVMYAVDNPAERRELRLLFNQVDRVERLE
jgi:hypothetical protein